MADPADEFRSSDIEVEEVPGECIPNSRRSILALMAG
jgi:hypothetical protein